MRLPEFSFSEVEELYNNDLNISNELYDSLLQKDRLLIIEDLKKVLTHSIENYLVFNEDNVSEENTFSVWHALFLLNDLKATEALPNFIELLKQDEELLALYIGDLLVNYGWEFFYNLGSEDLRSLIDFAKTLTDDYVIRLSILDTLEQVFVRQPERKLEIEAYLRELLFFASVQDANEDLFLDELTEQILETIIRLKLVRLYPEVQKLLNEDKLTLLFGLPWKNFENKAALQEDINDDILNEFTTRVEIYTEYLEATDEDDEDVDEADVNDGFDELYAEFEDDEDFEDLSDDEEVEVENLEEDDENTKSYISYEESHIPFVAKEPNVGRNEPCPCGSGKKYKKCHGKS